MTHFNWASFEVNKRFAWNFRTAIAQIWWTSQKLCVIFTNGTIKFLKIHCNASTISCVISHFIVFVSSVVFWINAVIVYLILLPVTVKLIRWFLVGEFWKSTRHRYTYIETMTPISYGIFKITWSKSLTPSSSKWTLSTLSPAGLDTVKKYALDPKEFESDHKSALAKERPRTSKLKWKTFESQFNKTFPNLIRLLNGMSITVEKWMKKALSWKCLVTLIVDIFIYSTNIISNSNLKWNVNIYPCIICTAKQVRHVISVYYQIECTIYYTIKSHKAVRRINRNQRRWKYNSKQTPPHSTGTRLTTIASKPCIEELQSRNSHRGAHSLRLLPYIWQSSSSKQYPYTDFVLKPKHGINLNGKLWALNSNDSHLYC